MNEERLLDYSPQNAFFVFDRDCFENNISNIQRSFSNVGVPLDIGYSFKTNFTPYICKTARLFGCKAEVVSPFEYSLARRYGFSPDEIIYNGVCKDVWQAYSCAELGGIVNCDTVSEFSKLAGIAKSKGKKIKLGVRVTFPVGNGIKSRFGIPYESKEFEDLLALLSDESVKEYVELAGIHCHISKARQLHYWRLRISKMVEIARKLNVTDYIDLGGDMFSDMERDMSKQFNGYCTMQEYASVIAQEIFRSANKCRIILEAGTPTIANSMSMYSRVTAIKRRPNYPHDIVILNTSKFDLGYASSVLNLPIAVYRTGKSPQKNLHDAVFTGYTCIEDDKIYRSYTGELAVGDTVVFRNVGAYSISQSPAFILPQPEILAVHGDSIEIIKRRSTPSDVLASYKTEGGEA